MLFPTLKKLIEMTRAPNVLRGHQLRDRGRSWEELAAASGFFPGFLVARLLLSNTDRLRLW